MAPLQRGAERSLRAGATALTARRLDLCVEGLEQLPRRGPLLIACRHYHHLYDGCALLATVPRPLHLLVALDWVSTGRGRQVMEWACRTARWPVVLRAERLQEPGQSAYSGAEAGVYLRRAVRDSVALLRAGRTLVIFPEAYPVLDPHTAPNADGDPGPIRRPDYIGAESEVARPFRPGVIRIAELAQRDGHTRVPIVPAGLSYRPGRRWQVALRFGAPLYVAGRADRAELLCAIEARVCQLSAPIAAWSHAATHEKSAVADA